MIISFELDLQATIEYLETVAVPVVGYQTNNFPAFYTLSSGLKTSARVDTPGEVVAIAQAHWDLGLKSAILVVQHPPEKLALPQYKMEAAVQSALEQAKAENICG